MERRDERGRFGCSDARVGGEFLGACQEDPSNAPEIGQDARGKPQGAFTRAPTPKNERQELGVGEGLRSFRPEAFPRAILAGEILHPRY